MADNAAKKVGRFVANEMLGVDDVKRAVSKAKKGDVRGALKSAATAAFEVGTSATAIGKGGALAAKAAAKSISKKTVEKTSSKVGDEVAKKVAEKTPAGKYGKAGGEKKTAYVNRNEPVTVTQKSGTKGGYKVKTYDPKKVEYKTRENSPKQREGAQQAQDTKRYSTIESAQSTSKEVSKKPIREALGDERAKTAARAFIAGKAVKGTQKDHAVTSTDRKTGKTK